GLRPGAVDQGRQGLPGPAHRPQEGAAGGHPRRHRRVAERAQPAERAHRDPGSAEHLRRPRRRRRRLQRGRAERLHHPAQGSEGGFGMSIADIKADPRDILIAPVVSEKSYELMEDNVYTFIVRPDANKTQIKIAVEKVFGVTVAKVNTLNRQGKRKRTRTGYGKRNDTKRALVTLTEDSKPIEIFGGSVS